MLPDSNLEGIYCEKCGSDAVTKTIVEPENVKKDNRVSIADYKGPSVVVVDLVYRVTTWLIQCKKCGNSKTIAH